MIFKKLTMLLIAAAALCFAASAMADGCPPHQFGQWETSPANCQTIGGKKRTCSACGYTETENYGLGDHQWNSWQDNKGGDCETPGTRIRSCAICGKTETDTGVVGGHKWSEWQETKGTDCANPGYRSRTCSVCGKTERVTTETGDHKWGEWRDVQGDCKNPSARVRSCTACGKTESIPGKKEEHKWGDWKTDTRATCTQQGLIYKQCTVCGETKDWTYTPKQEHTFGEWVTVIPAQIGQSGLMERKCTRCGQAEQKEIDPLKSETAAAATQQPVITPEPIKREAPVVELKARCLTTPGNGQFFVPGETVQFRFTIVNSGKTAVNTLKLYSVQSDGTDEDIGLVRSINPGFSMVREYYYTVTDEDAERTFAAGKACAEFNAEGFEDSFSVYSDEVKILCGKETNTKNETLLTDGQEAEAGYCFRMLLGSGDDRENVRTYYCRRHRDAFEHTRSAETTEDWQHALNEWTGLLNELYGEMSECMDEKGQAVLAVEKKLFFEQAAAYQTMVRMYGVEDDAAAVEAHVRQIMEKTVDLCNLLKLEQE